MVGTPLAIDIWPGAIEALAPLLADRRISSGGDVAGAGGAGEGGGSAGGGGPPGGHVAVAVGPGQGEEIAEVLRPQLGNATIMTVEGGSVEASRGLAARLHEDF